MIAGGSGNSSQPGPRGVRVLEWLREVCILPKQIVLARVRVDLTRYTKGLGLGQARFMEPGKPSQNV
jgi:hypothetical protein